MTDRGRSPRRPIGIAVVLAVLLIMSPAWAWHHQTAHRAINENAIQLFQSNFGSSAKYARAPWIPDYRCTGTAVITPGGTSIEEGDRTFSTSVWIREGGYYADEPEWTMALRHFYDPFSASGVAYLTDTVPDGWGNPNVDARTWALDHTDNLDSWREALLSYRLAMELDEEDRDRDLARAFRGLGETMHMLADMTQPAHVRNDSHPRSEPVEDTVRRTSVDNYGLDSPDPAVSMQVGSLEELFDNLASFTNRRFYSCDTIYDVDSGVLPFNGEAPSASPQFSQLTLTDATYHASFSNGPVPVIQETLTGAMLRELGAPPAPRSWHVPVAFADAQASVLIPLATNAGALALDMFFPTIDLQMTLTPESDGRTKVEGEMVHLIENDPEWERLGYGTIRYNGPGVLMRSDGRELAETYFNDGTMEPVTVAVKEEGDENDYDIYLRVEAGAREFTSEPTRPPEELSYPLVYQGTATREVFVSWDFDGGGTTSQVQSLDVEITLWANGSVSACIGDTPSSYLGCHVTTHDFEYTCPAGGAYPGETHPLITLTFDYSWDGRWYPDGTYDMSTSYYYEQAVFTDTFTDAQISGSASYPERTFTPEAPNAPCGMSQAPVQVRVELTLDGVRLVSSG